MGASIADASETVVADLSRGTDLPVDSGGMRPLDRPAPRAKLTAAARPLSTALGPPSLGSLSSHFHVPSCKSGLDSPTRTFERIATFSTNRVARERSWRAAPLARGRRRRSARRRVTRGRGVRAAGHARGRPRRTRERLARPAAGRATSRAQQRARPRSDGA